ncbi:MAG TPA: 2-amino-4-hydroxy-6-hydroxymethyldihydropteridine diphosphokinase [Humibacter sp.]|nr:2-amino-4-hydroxy-6-hydroxymethyldihydropteridine diphosphokinase [Humibacter sp.]
MTPGVHAPRPQRMRLDVPAVLALGSNLGDREATLHAAIDDLQATAGIQVQAVSPFVETPALRLDGVDDAAPRYLNAVALIRTTLDPLDLLGAVGRIEDAHGRVRSHRWGDRTLDIDIIDVDGRTMQSDRLTLPHPRAAERAFVLVPWLQVDPDAVLPGHGRVTELAAHTTDRVEEYHTAARSDEEGGQA